MEEMKLPTRMIHQSSRYVLGRRSYAVGDWCDWFVANHKEILANELAIIRDELNRAFEQDNDARERESTYKPLGADCDRAQWLKVLLLVGRD